MKGRTKQHPVPLFCLRRADIATESQDILFHVSHAIVFQRHGNITVLREMIAGGFYGLCDGGESYGSVYHKVATSVYCTPLDLTNVITVEKQFTSVLLR